MNPIVTVVLFFIILATALLGLGAVFGRRVVGDYGHGKVKIEYADDESVTFRADRKTSQAGTFGLWFDEGHALIGEVLSTSLRDRTVTRKLLDVYGPLTSAGAGVWEGDVFREPAAVGPYRDVTINTPLGPAAAWQFDGENSAIWAIHVHGIRTTRINALRTVPAVDVTGATSLVIAYRGDVDGPAVRDTAASLGLTEWRDVDAAVEYALANGAAKVILIGWSMGASMVLLASERSPRRSAIAGMILISPPTDWRQTMKNGAKTLGLPFAGACAWLAELVLGQPRLCRLVGLSRPLDFDALNWLVAERVEVPCLVIHSAGDRTVPVATSRAFVAANPDLVEMYESADTDHAWEYNVGPDDFNKAVESWLLRHIFVSRQQDVVLE